MHRLSAYVIVHRTQTNQTPNGIRLDGERNLIRRRTESDQTADASGGKSITYAHAKLNCKALIVIKINHDTAEV